MRHARSPRGLRHDDGAARVRMKAAQERIPSRLLKLVRPSTFRVERAISDIRLRTQ
jgi:hypothetical protein